MEENLDCLQAYCHTKTGNALISYFLFLWYSIFSTFSVELQTEINLLIHNHIKSNRNHVNIVYKTCKVLYYIWCIFSNLDRTMLILSLSVSLTHTHTVIFHTATFLFQSPCLIKIFIFDTPGTWFTQELWSKMIISNAQQWYCKFCYITMTSHLANFLTRIQYHHWLICSHWYWKYFNLLCNQLQHINIEHISM